MVAAAMETVRETIDAVVAQLEQTWWSPPPDVLQSLQDRPSRHSTISDRADVEVFRGALAAGARHLVIYDQDSFPHGKTLDNVAFWHPDTFLTALFQTEDELYVDVRLDLGDLFEQLESLPPLRPKTAPA